MMFFSALISALVLSVTQTLALAAPGDAEDLVREDRIKVFLYAAPAFWQEVAVDAYRDACTNLDNNLIDGSVQSILVGGHDIVSVLQRKDSWYCTFYDNYGCIGDGDPAATLVVADGVNNLQSVNKTNIHAFRCRLEDDRYFDK
ncbi:uncharacterized protein EI97DRAFT_456418 [Westerdykella ornata]|uniref:Ecp2 effector protein domain-containing protein n=1 Tax=Westerdykella ornata TaxID=318751 RepID=A0A6A6JVD7_WESOR|nr:uncharacterized protein EI97DRAFT_456418 [Westerdykella ornata]KAF2279009.1 hypothetical protein EI97DRAFT_456418 [Westerdykella ornata]